MNIKLNYLHLTNFKGIKDFKLIADGKNISIYGNNAVGKTSIIDSFMWLLFDKDSNNNADTKFDIKPQDEDGNDINHLQTVVEVELLVGDKLLEIKKMREEKWVTRRGTTEPVMDGHIKSYWFNEVPVKAREYQSKVDELVKEDIFKMITDPLYFNTKLSWQERREILLEISGDATDEEVINTDESLVRLAEILKGRSIDDYKLVLADQLKNYKKERDNIPPRIDELTRSLPVAEPDYSLTEKELQSHKDELATVEFLLTNANNKANKISEKYQELAKLKIQLEEIKTRIKTGSLGDKTKLIEQKVEHDNKKYLLETEIANLNMQIERGKRVLEANSNRRTILLSAYHELKQLGEAIRSEQFVSGEMATNCPTCEQEIPREKIVSKVYQLQANFEEDKENRSKELQLRINENMTEGKSLKENTAKTQSDLELSEKELAEKKFHLENIQRSINTLNEEISKPVAEPDYTKYQEYTTLSINIEKLQTELDKPVNDESAELLQKKSFIQSEIDELNKVLNGKAETENKKARIEELKAEEKRVSTLIAELEGHKFILERFTVAKVNLLEDSINSQFKHVKFKLFEENITNEGVKETCIALVNTNGSFVDYNTNSNSAGKINAGIDVINSLSKFYEVTAPIFTDNAESVTDLADTDSQVIRLVKPEIRTEEDRNKYSKLVVEVQ